MSNIIWIRHPQPKDIQDLCYGQLDVDIEEESFKESIENVKKLELIDYEIFSSPLQRCFKLAKASDLNFKTSDLIKEISFGEYEGMKWSDFPKEDLESWAKNLRTHSFPQGESYTDLKDRVQKFLNENTNKKLVLITHSGVIRSAMEILYNFPIEKSLKVSIPYGTPISDLEEFTSSLPSFSS